MIKKACAITTTIFNELIVKLKQKKFSTEKEIADYLEYSANYYGCKLAFPSIVANNNSEIHVKPRDKKLTKGFLIVDFGVKYKGYCSDCTRTFYIGKPSKKEIELYELVLLAQETALQYAVPGVYAADIDLIARNVLVNFPMSFRHALGHGVGRKIHQRPRVSPNSKDKLKKGQTITIEPGLYYNKLGIRIEDTIIVKEKPEILTKVNKKLIRI